MAMTRRAFPLQSLAIYKLRDGTQPKDALQGPPRLATAEIPGIGTLYIRPVHAKPPRWAGFFAGHVDPAKFGRGSMPGAVLFVTVDDDHFALTFGAGRFLLDPARIELSFGLDVARNLVGAKRLRSVDKQRLDRAGTASRVQTARESSAGDFGIDYDQDLLRSIAGAPEGGGPGESVAGLDVLRLAARVQLTDVPQLLRRLRREARRRRYLTTFPGMDQITPVRAPEEISRLDDMLAKRLEAHHTANVALAAPDILDWPDIAGFRFRSRRSLLYPELRLETLIELLEVRGSASRSTLDRIRISAVRGDETVATAWSAYRCIHAELAHDGRVFVLNGGRWYSVAATFVGEVNDAMKRVEVIHTALPEYAHTSEGAYNEAVARLQALRIVLLDKRLVHCSAARGGIEFCDLFSADGDIIHVKRAGGSDVYSHWFAQASMSAELLKCAPEFREKLNTLLPSTHSFRTPHLPPDAAQYRVVLAVIGGPASPSDLPFFSRINLRATHRRLAGLGFRVAFTRVPVTEEHERRVRVAERPPRRPRA